MHLLPEGLRDGGHGRREPLILAAVEIIRREACDGLTVAALAAGLYAEAMATVRRDPSTYYIYPAIIPMIPGDLFYYALVGVYINDAQMVSSYSVNCLLTLLGMSIGFVLSSIVAHYIRKMRFSALRKVSISVEDITEIEDSPFRKDEFGDEDA